MQSHPGFRAARSPAAWEGGAEARTQVSAAGGTGIRRHPSAESPMSWISWSPQPPVEGSPPPGPEGVGGADGGKRGASPACP